MLAPALPPPAEPIIGGVGRLGCETTAWAGGAPDSSRTGLHHKAAPKPTGPKQCRGTSLKAMTIGSQIREQGVAPESDCSPSVDSMPKKPLQHAIANGLDTVMHLSDPDDPTEDPTSVSESPGRFTVEKAEGLSERCQLKCDDYDRSNDAGMRQCVTSSLSTRAEKGRVSLSEWPTATVADDESAAVAWVQVVHKLRSSTDNHLQSIEEAIKRATPKDCPGQDLSLMAADMRTKGRGLQQAGVLEPRLLDTLGISCRSALRSGRRTVQRDVGALLRGRDADLSRHEYANGHLLRRQSGRAVLSLTEKEPWDGDQDDHPLPQRDS